MGTLTLELPDSFADKLPETAQFLAVKFYETGKVSLAEAALMAELNKEDFITVLRGYGIPV